MSSPHRLRDELVAAQVASGRSTRVIAREGGISHGTVSNYLAGNYPEHVPDDMLERFAKGLGVPVRRLKQAHLDDLGLAQRQGQEPTTDVRAAIVADPDLLPEAKEHLLRQYGLLLRVRADDTDKQTEERTAVTDLRRAKAAKAAQAAKAAKAQGRKGRSTDR